MSRVLTKNANPETCDLTRLVRGEEVWLWRLRQPSPREGRYGTHYMSQADAAKHLGIGFTSYQRLEAGGHIRFMIDASDLGSIRDISQIIGEVSKPTRAEMCTLARRRSGLKLEEIAACLGTTHVTILKLERTADPKIVRFWVDEGYNFGPTEDFIETMEEEQIA